MAKPWVPYVVQQGDHLDKIAFRAGAELDTIWSATENQELAKRRPNRNTLLPGDVIFVPSEPSPALSLQAGATNAFRARVPKVRVTLHLKSERDIRGNPFEARGAIGDEIDGTVGPDNAIQFEVAVWVREVEIRIPAASLVVRVRVGDLDPIEEPSGAAQRLENLGYLPRGGGLAAAALGQAIRAFQRDNGLPLSGSIDDTTRDALARVHRV